MKKKIIIAIVVFLVLALGVGSYFLFFNKDEDDKKTSQKEEKITITFDTDGGTKVEDLKVKKGSSFSLPQTTKEGYAFVGWYNGSTAYTDENTNTIKKNIVLTAKWEEVTSKDVAFTVTFDSKGGSKVKDMTFKCSDGAATLKNLPKSKKDAYNFMSWEDKHGKSILDGASIVCEDKDSTLKLYAVWEYDGPVANPEQNLEYKCPNGYSLKDTNKCVKLADATPTCTTGKYSSKAGKCYSYSGSATKTCSSYKGYTGKYFDDTHGHYGCAYGSMDSYPTSTVCNEHHYTWNDYSPSPHCWAYVVNGSTNVQNNCPAGTSYESATTLGGTQNAGCYTLTNPTKKCPDGYTNMSTYGECAMIKYATYE